MRTFTRGASMTGDWKELHELLEGYDTALLTTRSRDGHFHTRPMQVQAVSQGSELWFATSLDSRKCEDLRGDPHCAVAFHRGKSDPTYVSISGMAELIRDRAVIRRMWNPLWRAWFPDGPD